MPLKWCSDANKWKASLEVQDANPFIHLTVTRLPTLSKDVSITADVVARPTSIRNAKLEGDNPDGIHVSQNENRVQLEKHGNVFVSIKINTYNLDSRSATMNVRCRLDAS